MKDILHQYINKDYRDKTRNVLLTEFDVTSEIWALHMKFDDYLFSNFGKIKSLKTNKIVEGSINKCGYKNVTLIDNFGNRKSYQVHRLICETFFPIIGNYTTLFQVNHLDRNKTNNHIKNLEWVTHQENLAHFNSNKIKKMDYGIKLTESDKQDIIELIGLGFSKKEIQKAYNISLGYVYQIQQKEKNNVKY